MSAVLVCAHVIQSHLLLGASGLRLEEDRLAMMALGTSVLFGARQSRIGNHVGHDVRQFTVGKSLTIVNIHPLTMFSLFVRDLLNFVHDFVNVDAVRLGLLLVVAVSARVQQNLVLLVLFRIQHVVAFLAKPNADESGAVVVHSFVARHSGKWLWAEKVECGAPANVILGRMCDCCSERMVSFGSGYTEMNSQHLRNKMTTRTLFICVFLT